VNRVLILAPYPWNKAPSQRFRFELSFKNTQQKKFHYTFRSFYSIKGWKKLYESSHPLIRLWLIFFGFVRRKIDLLLSIKYDYIVIHRELTPIGPPIFEWFIAKVLRKKIIFDFDDAIWMNDGHDSKLSWWLKSRWKISKICQWSWKVSAGNQFLADYARQYCDRVEVIPTVVDTDVHSSYSNSTLREPQSDKQVVGWTGSHSTLFYLDIIIPVIQRLQEKYDFNFLVIANKDPKPDVKNYQFVKWNRASEINDLQKIDIGIMPLENTEWARGKCGFKLIQYGAIGIPSVSSPVGVNSEIIQDGVNGFLASREEEWHDQLETLIIDPQRRQSMGRAARNKIVSNYSSKAIQPFFLNLFKG
jgi:glycosyltransferase involved in cell wall biosynthesis